MLIIQLPKSAFPQIPSHDGHPCRWLSQLDSLIYHKVYQPSCTDRAGGLIAGKLIMVPQKPFSGGNHDSPEAMEA